MNFGKLPQEIFDEVVHLLQCEDGSSEVRQLAEVSTDVRSSVAHGISRNRYVRRPEDLFVGSCFSETNSETDPRLAVLHTYKTVTLILEDYNELARLQTFLRNLSPTDASVGSTSSLCKELHTLHIRAHSYELANFTREFCELMRPHEIRMLVTETFTTDFAMLFGFLLGESQPLTVTVSVSNPDTWLTQPEQSWRASRWTEQIAWGLDKHAAETCKKLTQGNHDTLSGNDEISKTRLILRLPLSFDRVKQVISGSEGQLDLCGELSTYENPKWDYLRDIVLGSSLEPKAGDLRVGGFREGGEGWFVRKVVPKETSQ